MAILRLYTYVEFYSTFLHMHKKIKKIIFYYNVSGAENLVRDRSLRVSHDRRDTTNSIKVLLDHYLDNETSYNSYYKDYRHNPYTLQTN